MSPSCGFRKWLGFFAASVEYRALTSWRTWSLNSFSRDLSPWISSTRAHSISSRVPGPGPASLAKSFICWTLSNRSPASATISPCVIE